MSNARAAVRSWARRLAARMATDQRGQGTVEYVGLPIGRASLYWGRPRPLEAWPTHDPRRH
jgi:hypothetical protein